MNLRELVAWQAQGYERFHAHRTNLALHLVVVPLFWLGNLGLLNALWHASLWGALGGAATMAISMAVQGKGHAMEAVPSIPFSGWQNALARIFVEQWWTFPRFVLQGGWARAWRASAG